MDPNFCEVFLGHLVITSKRGWLFHLPDFRVRPEFGFSRTHRISSSHL